MAEVDPETLLEWLQMGHGEERDMQLIALEQLCMLLLMADNVDRCFESCPPRTFLPALCKIFLDEHAPNNVLEVTARAITYYLDVSAECTRRIIAVEGAVKALCNRLVVVEPENRTSKDLAEQCIKVLEFMCTRESGAIFEAGGLQCVLSFIRDSGHMIHKDTLHSAMAVVSRLCGKMEPSDTSLETCVASLSTLLKHEDNHVSDGALRCFASLADRFTRRGVDPAPLAQHGLTEELLDRLSNCGLSSATPSASQGATPRGAAGTTPDAKGNANVSTVISLLSTLCRGSPSVTHDLLRAELPQAIEKALLGDERCILDTMRLVDLLLVLLFEGRKALPKSTVAPKLRTSASGLRRLDSAGERTHRHLIDCIRSKDTDALIDAIDTGSVEVNYMDDVGQTLLNWASAFGTQEMVEFLCERGADVNRGQRSSSLHYAACFGRPQVAKTLLRHGANPDLRDEDGKTPLDKARERNDEGHREVIQILQSPGEWMVPVSSSADASIICSEIEKPEEEILDKEPAGDPEMVPTYLRTLLPIFAQVYNNTMMPSVRKATLALIRKMVHYAPSQLLGDIYNSDVTGFTPVLVEVLAAVLDHEDDDEGHLTALQIIQDLMMKGQDLFLDHFARLGVFSKVSALAGSIEDLEEEGATAEDTKEPKQDAVVSDMDDAKEILTGRPYHWKDWCLARGRDCLYVWSDAAALELSNGSNGWFRFILDGKLATMYSSGSPEGGSDSSESRSEFIEKLQRARNQVRPGSSSQPILTSRGPTKLVVGNWSLQCVKEGELIIHNSDGQQQATILKEELAGFIFESNRGTKHSFTAETSLGPEFSTGWTGKKGKRLRSKAEQVRQKVKSLAHELYHVYFKAAESHPRDVVAKLHQIVEMVERACELHNEVLKPKEGDSWKETLKSALLSLSNLLKDENSISAYELHSSGLVQVLLNCLNDGYDHVAQHDRHLKERISVFKAAFKSSSNDDDDSSSAVVLVRKLISVLESIEKLPLFLYDAAGSACGLQVLTRRLRFRLERAQGETTLIDRTGRTLKMEPLATVSSLERYLQKMVSFQWYDYERTTFVFVKRIKESAPLVFRHTHDFDENGLIYWIGTNGKTAFEWVNPAAYNLVSVSSSEGKTLPYGRLEDILSRDASALNCHTNDDKKSWFSLDLGIWLIPSAYTLRHARGYGRSALRNWIFQVSKDGQAWTSLLEHNDDSSLNEPGSTATWPLEPVASEKKGWRHIRLQQNGKNASGQTHYLSLSGLEIYGTVTGVVEEQLTKPLKEPSPSLRKQQRLVRSQMLRQMVMGKGKDWKWCELMGEPGQDSASERESAFFAAVLKAATQSDSARTSESVTSLVNKTLSASSSTRQPLMSSSSSSGGWQQHHHHHQRQPQQPQQQQVHPPVFGRSKSSSTPSLSATEEAENKAADRDHASTSDLSRSIHPFTAVMESVLSAGAEGVTEGQDDNKNVEPDSQPENSDTAETKTDAPIVPSTSSMSVSVPNLSSAKDVVSTLAESLPSLRRHSRGSVGSSSSVLSNRSNTLQSTFVRFPALASTLSDPGNNFLSSAQSAPNLPSAVTTTPPPSVTTNTTNQSTVATGTLNSALATSLTSTSSESDNEFLETCRASSLLAELEDEDFCGDPEDLDDENEDDSGDDYDEFTEEDEVENRGRGRKAWDDEHVLRRQFSALVPAFDPRPGRTNVQQTTDLEVPSPGTPDTSIQEEVDTSPTPKLSLYLKGPGLAGTSDTQVLCDNMESTIFRYVQNLYQLQSTSGVKQDRLRRIWEPTYVVIYGERKDDEAPVEDENVESPWTVSYVERHLGTERLPKSDVISMMQQLADLPFLRRWKLIGNARSVRKSRNCVKLVAAYKEFIHLGFAKKSVDQSGAGKKEHLACTVDDVLQLLRVLHVIANDFRDFEMKSDFDTPEFSVPTEEFYSKKINNKLVQQIQDPLVLSSLALPSWCEKLTHRCPMLFPFETRQLYFNCTAYGVSRAIVWLQGKREATTDRVRTPSTRREEQPEFQVGRLKHERVKVPRGDQLLEWAVRVMELHSRRKSILEVEFLGEEGTGLGPTLEFYALVAAELQKKQLGMWLCEDDFQEDFAREVDIGEGIKPPGFYIQRTCGLFPAPLIQDSEIIDRIVQLFHFLGIFLAKCLQDSRMVDLPLSQPFLKLMCSTEMDPTNSSGPGSPESSSKDSDIIPMDLPFHASLEDIPELISDLSLESNDTKSDTYAEDPPKPKSMGWFYGILTWEDLELIDPHRAHFLRQLQDLVDRKKMILKDKRLTEEEKKNEIQNLALDNPSGLPIRLEDLSLTFCYNPPSSIYGYTAHNLKPNGSEIPVTIENAEEYIKQVTDFCLHSGIKKQMEAFKAGFNEVFPMDKLQSFSSGELQTLMCGDQAPNWTREDILNYTEPKLGYTRESPGFQKFVNVLCSLNGDERKAFLQFTTGCSSLPPGGLANLHPRLTIVRKIDANDHTYPSVNTCVHYLKLPEYSSEDIMKQRLLGATREKGFHLN